MSIGSVLISTVIVGVLMAVITFAIFFSSAGKRPSQDSELLRSGTPASARIVEIIDTGNRYNANPQVRLKLEVQPESGQRFPAEVLMVLSVVDLQKYQAGSVIQVKYDVNNPARVVIVPH